MIYLGARLRCILKQLEFTLSGGQVGRSLVLVPGFEAGFVQLTHPDNELFTQRQHR